MTVRNFLETYKPADDEEIDVYEDKGIRAMRCNVEFWHGISEEILSGEIVETRFNSGANSIEITYERKE